MLVWGVLIVEPAYSASGSASGLPLPRFVSLNTDRANMRKGPGRSYPIAWVLVRRDLPVEVIGEYDHWRKVRDRSGDVGWIHRALLSGKRTAMIAPHRNPDKPVSLFADASHDRNPVLHAESGVIGEVLRCREGWCALAFADHEGWIPGDLLWGVYPDEVIE